MSTTHHPTPRGEVAPYEGEYVWAEFVDDEEPGPRPNEDQEQPAGTHDRRRPAHTAVRAAAIVLRAIAGHTLPGLRHARAAVAHWTTLGYMSGEEIRRRLVKRHLDTYVEQREDITADINRLGKKAQKLTRDAVDYGLTAEEGRRLKDVATELKLRRTAGKALTRIPFDVAGAQPTGDQIRQFRTVRALGRFVGVIVPAGAAALGVVLAAPLAGLVAVPVLAGAAWWLGRHPLALTQRALPAELVGPRELEPLPGVTEDATVAEETPAGLFPGDDGKPFPIRAATTPEMATECVRRALCIEGMPLAHVGEAVSYPWGWETVVRVSEGTPAAIADKLGALETRFDVGDGDVILEPNRKRTAEALLRVVTGDLFGEMKPPPYRAPHSVDINAAGVFGMSADGSDLSFSLAELMGEVIARSGGGKSTIMRDLLDWTTAAHNAVTVFLDPSGDGPGQFTDAIKLPITHPIHIEFALLSLYRLATGRARIRRKLGMGDNWQCTREHPAVIAFIEEFPKLTKRSKQIIAELMLVGRKEGIWIIFAAQGATKELLGSNIAEHPALKILGACRAVDTVGALGGGAADFGYLPHRLRPKSGSELNHCAQTYIVGAPGLSEDPMLHKWHFIPDDEGGRRAAERLAAGLVDVDQASIDAALSSPNPPGLKFADEDEYLHYVPWPKLLKMVAEDDDEPEARGPADLPLILRAFREAFEAAENPDFLLTDQVLDHLAHFGPEWRQWDGREPADRRREGAKKIARELKKAGISTLKTVRRTDLDKDTPPSGYLLTDVEEALDAYRN